MVPCDGTGKLGEDFGEEGNTGKDTGGFGKEFCGLGRRADDEAAVVDGGTVLMEPGGDGVFIFEGKEMGEVSVVHCGVDGRHCCSWV